jgi:hypothetical protein
VIGVRSGALGARPAAAVTAGALAAVRADFFATTSRNLAAQEPRRRIRAEDSGNALELFSTPTGGRIS